MKVVVERARRIIRELDAAQLEDIAGGPPDTTGVAHILRAAVSSKTELGGTRVRES